MPEFIPRPPRQERSYQVNGRFSLENGIVEQDIRTQTGREVVYSVGAADQEMWRERLAMAGLVLGNVVLGASGHHTYQIPVSARPLRLEAPLTSASPFAYDDAKLMADIGRLSARISDATDGHIIAGPAAERAFAVVDFIEPGAEHLQAIPGVEKLLVYPHTDTSRLEQQAAAFSLSFGERFTPYFDVFVANYTSAAEQRL